MHSIISGRLGILAAMMIAACADPVRPTPPLAYDPAVVAAASRQRATAPVPVPDSVGIPPSFPPIFEELPAEVESP